MAATVEQPIPLLRTKMFVPRVPQQFVARPDLFERLDEGLQRGLLLVSAPTGFGKTTLLSAWVQSSSRATAWLSLDEGDNDPIRFLAYVIAALQSVDAQIGLSAQRALQSPQPPAVEALLTTLINDISARAEPLVLVLDDYHLIEDASVDQGVSFLLEHRPPQLTLVIATRQDPPFPLSRRRARGQLLELRVDDLRFPHASVDEFLNRAMGLQLGPAEVGALEARTEGWVAGLQLAALSLRNRQDVAGFISAFAGDHRYIAEYLVDEVLQRQPDDVRTFLLHTAVLERLSGPLCDAVTGQGDGQARLEMLARGNFFLLPLDHQRQWFRYHHLFADVLQALLLAEQPTLPATLHLRASVWYEQQGAGTEAIRHALAAGDMWRAAGLIEAALTALRRGRLGVTLLGWLRELPDELIRRRPVLSAAYAWALLAGGELDEVEPRLQDAEHWLEHAGTGEPHADAPLATAGSDSGSGMVVVDEDEWRRLPELIAVYRAARAQLLGDIDASARYAREALARVAEDDHVGRGGAASLLGLASWAQGDLDAAQRHYGAGMASLARAGFHTDVIIGAIIRAEISLAQGRLQETQRILEAALRDAAAEAEPALFGMIDLQTGLSELSRERNDLDAATEYLLRGQALAAQSGVGYDRLRWCVAMARIEEARGNAPGALAQLDEAQQHELPDFNPTIQPLGALQARVWIAQGRLEDARRWAREQGLTATDAPSYLREFEQITLARLTLAELQRSRDPHDAAALRCHLERLLVQADAGGRLGRVIELSLLLARVHWLTEDVPAALASLARALAAAEPEGYVRVFLDEGPALEALLEAAAERGIAPAYVGRLRAAAGAPANDTAPAQDLIEPLSERELDVLRLLATDLAGPEIADRLHISLNTMRTHTKNIYSKLGVNNRRAAVRQAGEMNLLSRQRRT